MHRIINPMAFSLVGSFNILGNGPMHCFFVYMHHIIDIWPEHNFTHNGKLYDSQCTCGTICEQGYREVCKSGRAGVQK